MSHVQEYTVPPVLQESFLVSKDGKQGPASDDDRSQCHPIAIIRPGVGDAQQCV